MSGLLDAHVRPRPASRPAAPATDAWLRGACSRSRGAGPAPAARVGLVAEDGGRGGRAAACADPAGSISPRSRGARPTRATRCRRWCGRCRTRSARTPPAPCTCGATSQDVLDTAAMLLARRAVCCWSTPTWRRPPTRAPGWPTSTATTPMMGRTLLQQALPITFGLKAASWLAGLDGVRARLADGERRAAGAVRRRGGHAGRAAPGSGVAVRRALAAELGLADPTLPWHTVRLPVADARRRARRRRRRGRQRSRVDVVLLAQSEVAEATEVAPRAAARRRCRTRTTRWRRSPPGPAPAARPAWWPRCFAAMEQEHERGRRHLARRVADPHRLLGTVGSAASWLTECLADLRLDTGPDGAQPVAAAGDPQLAGGAGRRADARAGAAGAAHDAAAAAVREAASRAAGRSPSDPRAGRRRRRRAAGADSAPDVGEAGGAGRRRAGRAPRDRRDRGGRPR